jgi:hypothetical protein
MGEEPFSLWYQLRINLREEGADRGWRNDNL